MGASQCSVALYLYNPLGEELDTPVLRGLIKNAETIFMESVFPSNRRLDRATLEFQFGTYMATGVLDDSLTIRESSLFETLKSLVDIARSFPNCSQKRLVLEKSDPLDVDLHTAEGDANKLFYITTDLEKVLEFTRRVFTEITTYSCRRQEQVASQLCSMEGSRLAVLNHGFSKTPQLLRARGVVVDVHHPFSEYPVQYGLQAQELFAETGIVDKETYLRSILEYTCQGEFREKTPMPMTWQERVLVSHHIASRLTAEQIIAYRDRVLEETSRLLGDILVDFLREETSVSLESILTKERMKLKEKK